MLVSLISSAAVGLGTTWGVDTYKYAHAYAPNIGPPAKHNALLEYSASTVDDDMDGWVSLPHSEQEVSTTYRSVRLTGHLLLMIAAYYWSNIIFATGTHSLLSSTKPSLGQAAIHKILARGWAARFSPGSRSCKTFR